MSEVADFRSDTVTRPTAEMREAIASAEVGDDVLGHDPTTLALEEEGARILGKEAALYMPSGSMCNLVAMLTHTRPGQELVLEEWAHMCRFEAGSAGAIAHLIVRTVPSDGGVLDTDRVAGWLSAGSEHTPPTGLVAVENTHNFHGGVVQPMEALRSLRRVCDDADVPLHMDGARVWNAAAATGTDVATIVGFADTVSVCLSKGLCAPVGSLLAGSRDFIQTARFHRKRVGGGMRQSGILAAAGLVSLRSMRERLTEDHARAARIASVLAETPGFAVPSGAPDTNIVFVELERALAADVVAFAADHDVLLYATGERQIRLVTHHDVDDDAVDRLLDVLARAV